MTTACQQHGCRRAAVVRTFWPGQESTSCATHAIALQALASKMGFTLGATPLEGSGVDVLTRAIRGEGAALTPSQTWALVAACSVLEEEIY